MNEKLVLIDVALIAVSTRTVWIFIRITDANGTEGFGEATLDGQQHAVSDMAKALGKSLVDKKISPAKALLELPSPRNIVQAAVVSGFDQALHDLIARHNRVSVADLIGGQRRTQVDLYANINRRTKDRSPAGFANVARLAVNAGFKAIKIAPFDEITRSDLDSVSFSAALDAGLARIAAVRQATGVKTRLMVDCHWRFNERGARVAIDECAQFKLHWLECPVPEDDEMLPSIARLREYAHLQGMLLAGGENIIGLEGLEPFLIAGAYDVVMPDVKYVGGLATMLRLSAAQAKAGVAFAPHNPSGPIAHAASLEVCAAVSAIDHLEIQFDETPMFEGVLSKKTASLSSPLVTLAPQRQGLGICIDPALFNDGNDKAPSAMVHYKNTSGT